MSLGKIQNEESFRWWGFAAAEGLMFKLKSCIWDQEL